MPHRFYLYAAAAVAVAVMLLALKLEHDAKLKAVEAQKTAELQATVNQSATDSLDRYHTETVRVYRKVERSTQAVQAAEGANQPIPPDVLEKWREGLEGKKGALPD